MFFRVLRASIATFWREIHAKQSAIPIYPSTHLPRYPPTHLPIYNLGQHVLTHAGNYINRTQSSYQYPLNKIHTKQSAINIIWGRGGEGDMEGVCVNSFVQDCSYELKGGFCLWPLLGCTGLQYLFLECNWGNTPFAAWSKACSPATYSHTNPLNIPDI